MKVHINTPKFSKTDKFLEKMLETTKLGILNKYGRMGVAALEEATPRDTGKTSKSWGYEIVRERGKTSLYFVNTNVVPGYYQGEKGVNIAIILQFGHGTRNGGYVVGRDYISPSIRPIFDKIADEAWKEVKDA